MMTKAMKVFNPWPNRAPRYYYNWIVTHPSRRAEALERLREVEEDWIVDWVEYYLNDDIMSRKSNARD